MLKTPIEELVGWMAAHESAGKISWDLAFEQCMILMDFEKVQFMNAHKTGQDSVDFFGAASFEKSEEYYDRIYGKK
jgi:hypothetical protein